MGKKDPRIDAYIARSAEFARPILKHLRAVVHDGCPEAEETLKWGHPSFTYKGIFAGMAAFKGHCTFGFWKDALLRDEPGHPGKNDQAMGAFGRITSVAGLPSEKALIRLVKKAAALHDQGVKVPRPPRPKRRAEAKVPAYLASALRKNKKALATFQGFSPSQRWEYIEWVTEAKGEETRARRLATAVAWMSEGKIRNWKYVRK
jgi:uncharacterized protein YdeI (YjbR/CyaY-like superfamily)